MPAAGGPRHLAAGMVGPVPAARGRVVYLVLADNVIDIESCFQ